MPDVMLRYRTASFFGKLYAPELLMGLQTVEEAHDIIDATAGPDGTIQVDVETLRGGQAEPSKPNGRRGRNADATDAELAEKPSIDPDTGEVTNTPSPQAQAEAGKPAPGTESSAPAYLDARKVLASIRGAKDHDTLAVAADTIQDCDPAEHGTLSAAYRQRLDELDGVRHAPENTTPTRNRRAAAADME
jgi:hypothetical protein